ncbi:MAG: hypothetical protein JSV52_02325 [Candidatus Zixiibacteriota bacterium]|nr:MAG: hypothetical protein JSV52_02325 [candidate division Zixibacteria bacterium]
MAIEQFNILGRKVKTLHEGELATGTYTVAWDGRDDNNRPVASGVYLYCLKTDDFIESRKMVLVK